MRSVRLKAKFFFLVLILLIASNGYSNTCGDIRFRTEAEAEANKTGKGLKNFFSFNWGNLDFDEKLLQYIRVTAIKDQGIDGYFNPRIQVCDYEGKDNCYQLGNGTSCRQIYGTQTSGAGVSAAVFIDWEGDTVLNDGKIKEGIAEGLGWEWADDVTDEEKKKFANSPKICACSQKAACMGGFFSFFSSGDAANTCDTCYQTAVKCAPVPLAPSPPPFCEQLAMSPPQVRIVPIINKDNDYFDPKVKVIIGDLREEGGKIGKKLGFPGKYGESEAEWRPISDKDGTIYYFKTYRKKDKLCAEYHGTERKESKRKLQFPARCFPTPPAPEPEVVEIIDENTLEVKIKMSKNACRAYGAYNDGFCTFQVNQSEKKVGPLSLKVVKPKIIEKTTEDDKKESNPQFKILREYGCVPNIETECKASDAQGKCKLDNLGRPEIEAKYDENPKSRMLCLSGWQPEPEESVLKKEGEIIPLKLVGASYAKYNAVYSKESNQFYYLPNKEEKKEKKKRGVDTLTEDQDQLNGIIFDKQGYVFFPDKNEQKKGECSYCVDKNSKINEAFQSNKGLRVVYKLLDGKREKKDCNQGDDGCLCFNEVCSRSTQYLKGDKPFYLRYEEVDCRDEDGKTLKNEKGEIQKCTQLKDRPIKANRTEVFYADKLCGFDLKGLKKGVLHVIKGRLGIKTPNLPIKSYTFSGGSDYTDDLSQYDYVEIEAWGGGEAGYLSQSGGLSGMPGDYIRTQLKIDPNHPIIRIEVGKGGDTQGHNAQMYGKPTLVEMCDLHKQNCLPLITVAGGGTTDKTMIHKKDLELEEIIIKGNEQQSTQDNQIAYIKDGQIKYKNVGECREGYVDGEHGAGGCIDRSSETYSKGSPGHVKISSVQVDCNEIEKIIDALIEDPNSNPHVSDLIKKLSPGIIEEIKKEIRKELLGSRSEDSKL